MWGRRTLSTDERYRVRGDTPTMESSAVAHHHAEAEVHASLRALTEAQKIPPYTAREKLEATLERIRMHRRFVMALRSYMHAYNPASPTREEYRVEVVGTIEMIRGLRHNALSIGPTTLCEGCFLPDDSVKACVVGIYLVGRETLFYCDKCEEKAARNFPLRGFTINRLTI